MRLVSPPYAKLTCLKALTHVSSWPCLYYCDGTTPPPPPPQIKPVGTQILWCQKHVLNFPWGKNLCLCVSWRVEFVSKQEFFHSLCDLMKCYHLAVRHQKPLSFPNIDTHLHMTPSSWTFTQRHFKAMPICNVYKKCAISWNNNVFYKGLYNYPLFGCRQIN